LPRDGGFKPRDGGFKPRLVKQKDYKIPTKRVGLVQSGPHHHLIENERLLTMI